MQAINFAEKFLNSNELARTRSAYHVMMKMYIKKGDNEKATKLKNFLDTQNQTGWYERLFYEL